MTTHACAPTAAAAMTRRAATGRQARSGARAARWTNARGERERALAGAGGRGAKTTATAVGQSSDTDGYENFETRADAQQAVRMAAALNVRVPANVGYQQTVRKSLTYSGMGLRSGEVELMRLRPAKAGEGRYFVKVPSGTIDASESGVQDTTEYSEEELEDMLLERVRMALSNDEEEKEKAREEADRVRASVASEIEAPGAYDAKEVRVPASFELASEDVRLSSELNGDFVVRGAEHLLSALEALGIDNCRIELEGTGEIPIMDGSASSYAYDISSVGPTPALSEGGAQAPRKSWKITENVMVQEGDAFMMFNVDDKCKLTYGIDFTYKSTAIGKQWESWTPTEDAPYVFHISPARTFGTINDFTAYFRAGYIKSGLEDCALIANGDQYWNAPVRVSNEPARHKLLDLIGDLSLLAEPGMSGVPVGHVVAYKAGHKLHAKFVKALAKASKEQVDAEIWSEGIDA